MAILIQNLQDIKPGIFPGFEVWAFDPGISHNVIAFFLFFAAKS